MLVPVLPGVLEMEDIHIQLLMPSELPWRLRPSFDVYRVLIHSLVCGNYKCYVGGGVRWGGGGLINIY